MTEYLTLPDGKSNIWITDLKFTRATAERPRNYITLFLTDKVNDSSAKTTMYDIYLPLKTDTMAAQMAAEIRIKNVCYQVAGFDLNKKTTIRDLLDAMKANLEHHNLCAEIEVSHKAGKSLDRDGNQRVFTEINSLRLVSYSDKTAYVSDIDFFEEVQV